MSLPNAFISLALLLIHICPLWSRSHQRLCLKSTPTKMLSLRINRILHRTSYCDVRSLRFRGGASSSSYHNYGDGRGDDTNGRRTPGYIDGYHDRYNKYERDDYDSSSPVARQDPYEEDKYYSSKREGESGYYDEEGRYHQDFDDRVERKPRASVTPQRLPSSQSDFPAVLKYGHRKLGVVFLSSGAAFTALGITLFFNKTLMRLGNLLFVCGVPLMIGPGRTLGYFLQPTKARATGCLACGIFLVLVGHPVIGILLEIFGLMNLFGNMFPLVIMMAKNLPLVGSLFGGDSTGRQHRRTRETNFEEYYKDYEDRNQD